MASALSAEVHLEDFLWCLWVACASARRHDHHTHHMIPDLRHAPSLHERQFPLPLAIPWLHRLGARPALKQAEWCRQYGKALPAQLLTPVLG